MKVILKKRVGTIAIVLLSAIAFVAACFVPAMADGFEPFGGRQGKGMDRPGHHRPVLGIWMNQQIVEELELTDDQVAQLKEADFALQESQLELKAQLENYRLQLQKAFADDSVNDMAVLQIAQKIADQKGELFVQNVESRLALGKILSADQIEKLKQHLMQQRRKGPRRGKQSSFEQSTLERPDGNALTTE